MWGRSDSALDDARIRELGLDPDDRRLRLTLNLTRQLIGTRAICRNMSAAS